MPSAENLVRNRSFQALAADGSLADWELTGSVRAPTIDPQGGPAGEPCLKLEGAGGSATMQQDVVAKPNTEYLFTAWVKSDVRVWVRLGSTKLTYFATDEWQRVVGLARTAQDAKLTVRLDLYGFRKPCTYWFRDVALRPVQRPEPPPRKGRGPTRLAQNGKPVAYVVYPGETPGLRELAERTSRAVAEVSGVEIPVVSDTDATEADRPVIKEPYRSSPLILLGRLGTNRAMWPAYNRFLCAADGHYPGGDGYVVRTASNVLRNNRDHLILGGSTEAGVARAVDRFVALVREHKPKQRGTLTLPWLLDVELGGSCLEQLKADDERWTQEPNHPLLPKVEPSYGTVLRFQRNAMAYYWTGWPSYKRRALKHLDQLLDDDAVMHHYVAEFFVRVWSMFDNSGVFSDEQIARVDAYLVRNVWEWWFENATWRVFLSPPYENVELMNRHAVAPLMADLALVDCLHDSFELEGDLRDLVEYRRDQLHGFMRHLVRNRWQVSLPGAPTTEHTEEFAAALFRYALDNEDYALFDTGNAARLLDLEKINHRTGLLTRPSGPTDHHLLLGILAHYYRDGRYATLLKTLPLSVHPAGHFMGRYICGVRRYTPGPELEPADASSLAGVSVPDLMPHHRLYLQRLMGNRYLPAQHDPDELLDLAVFRSGFERQDDYVAVSGLASVYPPGVFTAFTVAGTNWFGATVGGRFAPKSDRYFDQNALSVVRADRWVTGRSSPAAARRDWSADLGQAGGVAFTLEPFMTARWQRQVIWVQPGLFVVRDVATALEDGQYELSLNLLPIGTAAWDGRTWKAATDTGQLHVTPLGERFTVRQNAEAIAEDPKVEREFRHTASLRLAEGESALATTVYQGVSGHTPVYRAELLSASRLLLSAAGADPLTVLWGPVETDELRTDAQVLTVTPERAQVLHATQLSVAGRTILDSPEATSTTVDDAEVIASLGKAVAALPSPSSPPQTADAGETGGPLQAADRSSQWQTAWSYPGLKRPSRLTSVRAIESDIVDFGRIVRLAQLRATTDQPAFAPAEFPAEVWTAVPAADGRMPPRDSNAWRKLPGAPEWRPSVQTANYGGSKPVEKAYQVWNTEGVQARYVRAEGAAKLLYYDAEAKRSMQPLCVEVVDLDGDGRQEIVAKPDVWRRFLREQRPQYTDESWAVLGADGEVQVERDERMNVQEVKVLDYDGSGTKHVAVLTIDGQVRLYKPDGELDHHFDLQAMHRQFNETEGRPDTRHPAGGLLMPYSMGLWRQADSGVRKLVVARYGWTTHIDERGEFEGVLALGGYVAAPMMDYGLDFDGDGQDEILTLACTGVAHLFGDLDRRTPDPKGHYFYPQVYHMQWCRTPAGDGTIDGPRALAFEPIRFGGGENPRYVLVARTPFLAIYDGVERKWAFTWVPPVTLRAVALVQDEANELAVMAATADNLVYRLDWSDDLSEPASFEARSVDATVRRMTPWPGEVDTLMVAADEGVHRLRGLDDLELLRAGAYLDVQPLREGEGCTSVIAVTRDGEVQRVDARD